MSVKISNNPSEKITERCQNLLLNSIGAKKASVHKLLSRSGSAKFVLFFTQPWFIGERRGSTLLKINENFHKLKYVQRSSYCLVMEQKEEEQLEDVRRSPVCSEHTVARSHWLICWEMSLCLELQCAVLFFFLFVEAQKAGTWKRAFSSSAFCYLHHRMII